MENESIGLRQVLCCPMPIAREGICGVILFPGEPLTVALDVTVHEEVSVMSSCVKAFFSFDFVVSCFDKICLSHPSFGC
jgi:hypothetical protein